MKIELLKDKLAIRLNNRVVRFNDYPNKKDFEKHIKGLNISKKNKQFALVLSNAYYDEGM